MTVSEIIKAYRERNDVSLSELARRSGISKPYIAMLERDVNPTTGKSITPSLETLYKLARGMGITIDDLMGMIDADTPVSITNAPEGWSLLSDDDKKRVQAFINALLASQVIQ